MSHGGKREGAGRKPTREKHAGKVNAAEKKLADKLPMVADALLELALGVMVEEVTLTGEKNVYQRPPDRAACEAVLNRIMGKPTEKVESEQNGALEILIKYDNASYPDTPPATPEPMEGQAGIGAVQYVGVRETVGQDDPSN